jgi:hypothetical protein
MSQNHSNKREIIRLEEVPRSSMTSMYDFHGSRHWSDVSDDDGSSGMGAICMAYLGRDWHRCDAYSCGCHD